MTIEVHAVQALRVYSEPAFATDYSGSAGSFTYVPIRENSASITLTRDTLDPQQLVQHIDEYRKEVLGKRSATLSFTMNLAPTGVAANTSTSSATGALGTLLKAVMGGEQKGQGSTSAAGSTATVINVQTGHGSRFSVGGALGWVNASSVLEVREIESISTDAITLKHALSGSPASTNNIFNVATYYMTANPSESLQFIVEGLESDDRWLLMGGQAVGGMTVALDVTGAALPAVTFNFTFANWKDSGETSSSLTGTLATASYTNYSPIVGEAGDFRVFTVGASTLTTSTAVHASVIAFTPKLSYVPYTSPSGTNTVLRWVKGRNMPPVEGTFTLPFQDVTWWTAKNNRTDKAVFYQFGTAAGSAALLSAPTVQVTNPQRAADAGGLAAQTVAWKGRRDTDTGASTTDIAKSPFRIHLA